MKKISIHTSIYDLVNEHSEIKDLLVDMGFDKLENKTMLNTVARVMTLQKVARSHNLSYDDLNSALETIGFILIEEEL